MSPEQARGRAADRRSDIWSFGVVLYELLTGRRLFDGETVSDVLASVLTREPDWPPLPTATPAHVAELLRRCLVRDPHERLQSIGDARIALQGRSALGAPAGSAAGSAGRVAGPGCAWAVSGVLAAALAAAWLRPAPVAEVVTAVDPAAPRHGLRPAGPRPRARGLLARRLARRLRGPGERRRDAPLRPDDRDGRVTEYPGSESAQFPFWSPDGRWIAFFSRSDGKLKKVPVEGGTPLTICRALNGKGGSWGRDDVIVLAPSSGASLHRVPAGGEPVAADAARGPRTTRTATRASCRTGGASSFSAARAGRARARSSWVRRRVATTRGDPRRRPRPSTPGPPALRARVRADGAAVRPRRREGTGEASPWPTACSRFQSAAFAAFSASGTGRVAFHSGETQAPVRIEMRDRKGALVRSLGTPGMYRSPSFSPDGRWIAATGHPQVREDNYDVWLFDVAGESAIRFTIEPAEDVDAVWSPDGKTLYYASNAKGPHDRVPQARGRGPRGGARLRGARAAEAGERLARR